MQKDESWRACAARELREESGLDGERLDIDWSHPVFAPKSYHVFYNGRMGDDFELANLQPTTEMAGFEIVTAAGLPQNSGFRLQEVVRAAKWTPTSPPPVAAGSPDTSSSSAQEKLPQATESFTSAKRSAARAAAAPKTKKRKTEAPESESMEAIITQEPINLAALRSIASRKAADKLRLKGCTVTLRECLYYFLQCVSEQYGED